MERNFSVDDIVGTLWKLDPNSGNHVGSTSNAAADPTHAASFGLEFSSLHDEIFKRIPRVDSESFFQDYFRLHDSAKAEGSDGQERPMRRNESMWAFQEFLKNCDLSEAAKSDSKDQGSMIKEGHPDDGCTLDLNVSPRNAPARQHDCSGTIGVRDGFPQDVQGDHSNVSADSDRLSTKISDKHSTAMDRNANSSIPTTAELNVGIDDRQPGQNSTFGAVYKPADLASLSGFSETSEHKDSLILIHNQFHSLNSPSNDTLFTKESQERQVSGALNPLFTGLQDFMPSIGNANPQEYEMQLKRQLDLACAAVAAKRVQQGPASSDAHARTSAVLKIEMECGDSTQSWDREVPLPPPLGIPALPPKPTWASSDTARINTSESSGEHSDDEADVESGVADQSAAPDDMKRVRRMLSNRESARRSRRRKQAHLSDLEMQVAQMRVENSSLFKQLTESTQKLNNALVDNRVLKSDVEALRAKVKMAEGLVERSTGVKNEAATPSILRCGVADQQPQHLGGKMGRTPSMQRVASLEHLQKKIRGGVSPLSWGPTLAVEGHLIGDQGSIADQ